jgi:hypothetical protein
VLDNQIGGPTVPCDIPAGAEEIFITELIHARALVAASEAVDKNPQRIVLTVSSGGRTFKSKPVVPALLAIGS